MSRKDSQRLSSQRARSADLVAWVVVGGLAWGLSWLFWFPLWNGGGLIGGDLYPYYFPQKLFLAEALQQGKLPLWNHWVGWGYPVLGESQTGVLYPFHLLAYRFLELNTAYSANQLLHYLLTFGGCWWLARLWGLSRSSACLAAVTYVYGWFPARICLEWAILGGAFQVWMLALVTRYRQTGSARWLTGIALMLGMHLLAGHYNLAFITLLAAAVLAVIPMRMIPLAARETEEPLLLQNSSHDAARGVGARQSLLLLVAVVCGFLIAAVQVWPTWELKGRSQRAEAGETFAPGYGHLPPLAITQLVVPWLWHGPEIDTDQALLAATWGTIPASTNKAEAYVYAGTLPLLFTLYGWWNYPILNRQRRSMLVNWSLLGVMALFFATGWPIVWLQHLPGFAFFMGPGRYTVLTTLAIGLIAGSQLDGLFDRQRRQTRSLITGLVTLITVFDLWAASREYQFGQPPFVGRQVFYATLVNQPPVQARSRSVIAEILSREPGVPRLYAPGPNAATLTRHSAVPVYLGIGPKFYVERDLQFTFSETLTPAEIEVTVASLEDLGVTHLLLEAAISPSSWPVERLFSGIDPLFNAMFGRLEPYHLYRLSGGVGRASLSPPTAGEILSIDHGIDTVTVRASLVDEAELIVRELMYPGWTVSVNGVPATPFPESDLRIVRVPAGEVMVEWKYRPVSVWGGGLLSLFGLIAAVGLSGVKRYSPSRA